MTMKVTTVREYIEQQSHSSPANRSENWYRISNAGADDDGPVTVHIYDEIGWYGTTAGDFIKELKELATDELTVRLNSRGGDVFDGIAIFNALRSHAAHVTTVVDAAAISIASVIAQAGDERVMMSGSQMMIHDAWGLAIGNAADLREYADMLDFQSDNIAGIYAERAGGTGAKRKFARMMAAETWLTPDQAVESGLADRVEKPKSKTSAASVADDEDQGSGAEDTAAKVRADVMSALGTEITI